MFAVSEAWGKDGGHCLGSRTSAAFPRGGWTCRLTAGSGGKLFPPAGCRGRAPAGGWGRSPPGVYAARCRRMANPLRNASAICSGGMAPLNTTCPSSAKVGTPESPARRKLSSCCRTSASPASLSR